MTHRSSPNRWLSIAVFLFLASLAPVSAQDTNRDIVIQDPDILRGTLRSVFQPLHDIELSARTEGFLVAYTIEEGQEVSAGEVLLRMEDKVEQANLARARALLEGTKAEHERAQLEFERAKTLRSENINSEKQFEDARINLLIAASRLQQVEASLAEAESQLEDKVVRSPIDGIFMKRTREPGEAIRKFEPVARVVDISRLNLTIFCDANLFYKIEPRESFPIKILEGPLASQILEARTDHFDRVVDPASGTFRIRLSLPNTQGLSPGMAARLILE